MEFDLKNESLLFHHNVFEFKLYILNIKEF